MSKLITVFGATGNQGGSVIRTVLSHPQLSKIFSIRAITRDTTKPSALALASKGVEVIAADLNDASSIATAIKGSHTVFGVTNFWENASADTELNQGKAIADASVAANVSHLIWSSLPNVTEMTKGVLAHVSHFDSKAHVEAYIRTLPLPASFFMPALFISAFSPAGTPSFARADPSDPSGNTLSISLPWNLKETKVPMIDIADDAGKFVAVLMLDAEKETPSGRVIWAAGGFYTPEEIVEVLQKAERKKVVFNEIPEAVFKGFLPEPVAEELTQNMLLIRDYQYYGPGAVEGVKEAIAAVERIGLKVTGLKEYLEKSG